ncbi:MAG: Na+/H+ antiporter NhaC family protein [Calditrichaeota bacterium]|nr:MAG: Na+/H+ antiporter NhaC family protein [Calditrichota bacterium]
MASAQEASPLKVSLPRVALQNIPFSVQLNLNPVFIVQHLDQDVPIQINEKTSGELLFQDSLHISAFGEVRLPEIKCRLTNSGHAGLVVRVGATVLERQINILPGVLSLLPPLLAILLALITHQVIIALFFGVWLGVIFLYDYNILQGFLHTLDTYLIQALADPDHVFIVLFTLILGGMVGVISRAGGTQGIVDLLARYAKDARRGQLATWAMGVLIFFDDYANTLIVGNTMRPLTDRLRISREKLSYLVDSTAAPVANIAIISTWIGYEISLISQSLGPLGVTDNPYILFIRTIPYNFYPIYALALGLFLALLLRDFGPMYRAELRARKTGQVLGATATPLADLATVEVMAEEGIPRRWQNAMIPILVVIGTVSVGLFYTGWQAIDPGQLEGRSLISRLSLIVGNADSFSVLMWASFMGSVTAILLALSQRLLSLAKAIDAWVQGIRSMIMAAIILTLAWSIGQICQELYTADYVVSLTRQLITPHWLPLITFLTAGAISFATGTSWGTMAILMPIAIPLAYKFPLSHPGIDTAHATGLLLSTTAAVLAGATFGDHCSPISDTTIMSSMASGADHIDHVRTQLPYAGAAALVASALGYIPVGFGVSNWLCLPLGVVSLFLIVRFIGKPTAG